MMNELLFALLKLVDLLSAHHLNQLVGLANASCTEIQEAITILRAAIFCELYHETNHCSLTRA